MSSPVSTQPGNPALTTATPDVDAQLQRAVRHATVMRRGFYLVVLVVALAGQASGAVQALHMPLVWAIPAVAALELGGVVVLANADVRRRLGEHAIGSRVLSAVVAAGAALFNWTAHQDPLVGGFFAGMSALGYLVWLTDSGNSRRDRLRAHGVLPPTTPAYEPFGHWMRHPRLTHHARSLARVNPQLGLYASLHAARDELDAQRRRMAIATVLHRKIRAAVDPATADIAVAVYNLDQIAERLTNQADYDGLTDLIAVDLRPSRLAAPASHARRSTAAATASASQQPAEAHICTADGSPNLPHPNTPRQAIGAVAASRRSPARNGDGSPSTGSDTDADQHGTVTPRAGALDGRSVGAAVDVPAAVITGVPAFPADAPGAVPGEPPTGGGGCPPPADNAPSPNGGDQPDAHIDDDLAGGDGSGVSDAVPGETAAAVAYWRRRAPDLSLAEVAARVGRSERTVYRHWNPAR